MKNDAIPHKGVMTLPVSFTSLERAFRGVVKNTWDRFHNKKKPLEIPKKGKQHAFIFFDKRLHLIVNAQNAGGEGFLLIFDLMTGYETIESNKDWFSFSVDLSPLSGKPCYAATKDMFDDTMCAVDGLTIKKVNSIHSFEFTAEKKHLFAFLATLRKKKDLTSDFKW